MDKLGKTTELNSTEAETLYDEIYNSPSYLSFISSWEAGTSTYTSLEEFTSGGIPSWFSVGADSVYSSYDNKIPDEIVNDALASTLTLTQQLGIYDYTMDTLGVDGGKSFNKNHTFTKYNLENIQKVYTDLLAMKGTTDIDSLIDPYRLTGQDGMLIQNLYHTYKDQMTVENVAMPQNGALNVIINKLKLAINILNEKDETGNSISTVATTQLNSNQLAHAQALYNKNNNAYLEVPTEILETLGLNPNLTNGTLTDGESVVSNVVGGQTFTDDQVNGYAEIIDASDSVILPNYGTIAANTNSSVSNELPDTQVQTPGDKAPAPKAGGGVGSGGK